MSFINKYSWKCLLGKQSKNIKEEDEIYFWDVGKKHHFCTSRDLEEKDISLLNQNINFHYLSEQNILFLKQHVKIKKTKNISVVLNISNMNFAGRKYHGIRYSLNRCNKLDLTIENEPRKIEDVKLMIDEWSNTLCDKYWQDHSGKNLNFISNNFHKNCISKFIYDKNKLIAFGILSPNQNENCSYIIGKALVKTYPGLSEWTDILLYKEVQKQNIKYVNLGQATKGLIFYKEKFPSSSEELHFNGFITV